MCEKRFNKLYKLALETRNEANNIMVSCDKHYQEHKNNHIKVIKDWMQEYLTLLIKVIPKFQALDYDVSQLIKLKETYEQPLPDFKENRRQRHEKPFLIWQRAFVDGEDDDCECKHEDNMTPEELHKEIDKECDEEDWDYTQYMQTEIPDFCMNVTRDCYKMQLWDYLTQSLYPDDHETSSPKTSQLSRPTKTQPTEISQQPKGIKARNGGEVDRIIDNMKKDVEFMKLCGKYVEKNSERENIKLYFNYLCHIPQREKLRQLILFDVRWALLIRGSFFYFHGLRQEELGHQY